LGLGLWVLFLLLKAGSDVLFISLLCGAARGSVDGPMRPVVGSGGLV
jgi:hypothetical protein